MAQVAQTHSLGDKTVDELRADPAFQAVTKKPMPGLLSVKTDEEVFNEGYRAQAAGKEMSGDNPYCTMDPKYWVWRKGFIEAFKDSN